MAYQQMRLSDDDWSLICNALRKHAETTSLLRSGTALDRAMAEQEACEVALAERIEDEMGV